MAVVSRSTGWGVAKCGQSTLSETTFYRFFLKKKLLKKRL